MSETNTQNPKGDINHFFTHFMRDQHQIYAFILIMVHNRHDADDLMQETAIILWEKFSEFDHSQSFTAWGIGVARNVIRRYHEAQQRQGHFFRASIYEALEEQAHASLKGFEDKEQALQRCMEKLNKVDQTLITLRYAQKRSIKDIANQMKRSFKGLYQTYARIHALLEACINRQLSSQEHTS